MWHSDALQSLAKLSLECNKLFEQFYQTVEDGNPDEAMIPGLEHLHSDLLQKKFIPATAKEEMVVLHISTSALQQQAFIQFLEGEIPIDTLVERTYGPEAIDCLKAAWHKYSIYPAYQEQHPEHHLETMAEQVHSLLQEESVKRGYLLFPINLPKIRITQGDPGWFAEEKIIDLPKTHFYQHNGCSSAVHIANDLAHEDRHAVHLAYAAAMPPCLSGDGGNLRSIASFPAVEGFAWLGESLAEEVALSCGFSLSGERIDLEPEVAKQGLDHANQRWFYLLDLCMKGYLQQKHGSKWAQEYERLEPGVYDVEILSQAEQHRFLEYLAYPVGLELVHKVSEKIEGPLWLKTALLATHASFSCNIYPKAVAYSQANLSEFLDYLSEVFGRDMQAYYGKNK